MVPIPSELILPFAGFLVGEGSAIEPLTGQLWISRSSSIAGDARARRSARSSRYCDRLLGRPPVSSRCGKYLRITPARAGARPRRSSQKYGAAAAFFGRLIPVVRTLVSFAAGVGRMPIVPFIVYTILGSLPSSFLLVFVGGRSSARTGSRSARS